MTRIETPFNQVFLFPERAGVPDTTPTLLIQKAGPQDGVTGDVPLILELAEAGGTADIYTVLFPNGETFPDGPQIIAGNKADNTPAPDAWTSLGQSEGSGLTAADTLVDELDGFFRFGVVAVDEAGNIGPPAYSVPIYINTLTVVPYVQNIVTSKTYGDSRVELQDGNLANSGVMTISFWCNFVDTSDRWGVLASNMLLRIRSPGTTQLQFLLYDSSDALVMHALTDADFWDQNPSKVLTHYAFHVDLSQPYFAAYKNAVDVTGDLNLSTPIQTGNGIIRGNNILTTADGLQLSDQIISFGELIPIPSLYNGGTPPDIGTLLDGPSAPFANAQFVRGGNMLAADWETGANLGPGTTFPSNGPQYVDVL